VEKVLVVEARDADKLLRGEGLILATEDSLTALCAVSQFLPRDQVEGCPNFRQLVSYVVVLDASGRVFACTRLAIQSEARLHRKVSIGIGGHINPIDGPVEPNIVRRAAWRELHEELHMATQEPGKLVFWGYINDKSTPVSRDHLGCLLVLRSAGEVTVKEKDKMMGSFVDELILKGNRAQLESWSSLCLQALHELRESAS